MSERYLADENFPAGLVQFLRTHGDDVLYAAESLISSSDEDVLREAVTQSRVLLTFDRDFGELVFRCRQPSAPGIVLFRLSGQSGRKTKRKGHHKFIRCRVIEDGRSAIPAGSLSPPNAF